MNLQWRLALISRCLVTRLMLMSWRLCTIKDFSFSDFTSQYFWPSRSRRDRSISINGHYHCAGRSSCHIVSYHPSHTRPYAVRLPQVFDRCIRHPNILPCSVKAKVLFRFVVSLELAELLIADLAVCFPELPFAALREVAYSTKARMPPFCLSNMMMMMCGKRSRFTI
jgi:hypothetical protein